MPDENPVTPPADNGRSEIPSHIPTPDAGGSVDLATIIPADFKDKDYLKDIKDIPSLFKKLDGAQQLIGKRPAGIPQDNAPEAEWQAFNKAFGVPEKPDAYEVVVPEKGAMPKEMVEGVKGIFHKAGLNPRQAKAVSEGWNALMQQQAEAAGTQAAQADIDFEKMATETFGERKTEALAQSREIISKYLPANMKGAFNSLPNEQLVILASVVDGIRKDYMSEDNIPGAKGGKPTGSFQDQREEARKLMASPEFLDPFHPNHESVKARVNAIYSKP